MMRGKGVRRPAGVALVEVLVAMLVVSVGVLAMAGLLATASRYGKTTEFRAVATLLAADMADRIRANKAALIAASTAYDVDDGYETWEDEPGDPSACANASKSRPWRDRPCTHTTTCGASAAPHCQKAMRWLPLASGCPASSH